MRNIIITISCCLLFLPVSGYARDTIPDIRLSELYSDCEIHLDEDRFLTTQPANRHDTLRISFRLINDMGKDTIFLLYSGENEWTRFQATPLEIGYPEILKFAGRDFFGKEKFESLYYPAQTIQVDSGAVYLCDFKAKGESYRKFSTNVWLATDQKYHHDLKKQMRYEETNFMITYIFLGAIGFGFFFFFFLYLKSRYSLYALYSLFLFIQFFYGLIEIDVYTRLGRILITHDNWDDYLNEFLAFTGQGVYVQFLIYWLGIRSNNRLAYVVFNSISIFFFSYGFLFVAIYFLNDHWVGLEFMQNGIRLIVFLFQLIVFYLIIFHIKSDVKSYVITGSILLIFFGVIMVFLNVRNSFDGTWVKDFDNGSWYMVGVLAESICFALGLGLRYFKINQDNIRLQEINLNALQEKLFTEQAQRESDRKLASLNQELTNQQLTALRAQMNPHFIFNALNSIQKYILLGSVDEANSYLSKFSKLQRMILSYCDENFITLDKEINMLRLYLELEQLRLTDDFEFNIDVAEDIEAEEIMIPPMMLQPFAENAIWHGLVPKEGLKKLTIKFTLSSDDVLTCIVEDNGVGRAAASLIKSEKTSGQDVHKSKGMSLVYNRLSILERKYGKEYHVKINDKFDQNARALGTTVIVSIPVSA